MVESGVSQSVHWPSFPRSISDRNILFLRSSMTAPCWSPPSRRTCPAWCAPWRTCTGRTASATAWRWWSRRWPRPSEWARSRPAPSLSPGTSRTTEELSCKVTIKPSRKISWKWSNLEVFCLEMQYQFGLICPEMQRKVWVGDISIFPHFCLTNFTSRSEKNDNRCLW